MNLRGIIRSEIRQRNTKAIDPTYTWNLKKEIKAKLIGTEKRIAVSKG